MKTHVLKHFKAFLPNQILPPAAGVEMTLELYALENRSAYEIAWLAMLGSYLFYDSSESLDVNWIESPSLSNQGVPYDFNEKTAPLLNKRRYFQAVASQAFERAWKQKLVPQGQEAVVAYLIAELYRRLGFFAASLPWFKVAEAGSSENPKFKSFIKEIAALSAESNAEDANFYTPVYQTTVY